MPRGGLDSLITMRFAGTNRVGTFRDVMPAGLKYVELSYNPDLEWIPNFPSETTQVLQMYPNVNANPRSLFLLNLAEDVGPCLQ